MVYMRTIPKYEDLKKKLLEQCEDIRNMSDHQIAGYHIEKATEYRNVMIGQIHWVIGEITEMKDYFEDEWPSEIKD